MTVTKSNQLPGRNRVEILHRSGEKIFKKWILGTGDERDRRIANLEKWDAIAAANGFTATARLLTVDHHDFSLEYEYIEGSGKPPDYSTVKHLVENLEDQKRAIQLLAQVHGLDPGDTSLDCDEERFVRRGINIADSISIAAYASSSGAELEFLRLIQNDPAIIRGCKTLAELRRSASRRVVTHGDFRPDQLIYSEDTLKIIDFEELCLAPPEFDIASFFGAFIFTILQKTIVDCSNHVTDVTRLGLLLNTEIEASLNYCFNTLQSLLDSYYSSFPCKLTPQLLTMELSWALFERIFSRAKLSFRLSEADKAIMGIAKELSTLPSSLSWKEPAEL